MACKYCTDLDAEKTISRATKGMGIFGAMESELAMIRYGKHEHVLSNAIWHKDLSQQRTLVQNIETQINYCPFCGRRLKDE